MQRKYVHILLITHIRVNDGLVVVANCNDEMVAVVTW